MCSLYHIRCVDEEKQKSKIFYFEIHVKSTHSNTLIVLTSSHSKNKGHVMENISYNVLTCDVPSEILLFMRLKTYFE